jgi:YceI-like domain
MASPGQVTAPALQALLDEQALAGSWVLDGARSTVGLRSTSVWGLVSPSGPGVTISGQLTVRDQTRPVSFDAAVSAAGAGEVTLDAEVPFNRADFGLTWNQLGISSVHSTLAVHVVFSRG